MLLVVSAMMLFSLEAVDGPSLSSQGLLILHIVAFEEHGDSARVLGAGNLGRAGGGSMVGSNRVRPGVAKTRTWPGAHLVVGWVRGGLVEPGVLGAGALAEVALSLKMGVVLLGRVTGPCWVSPLRAGGPVWVLGRWLSLGVGAGLGVGVCRRRGMVGRGCVWRYRRLGRPAERQGWGVTCRLEIVLD